MLRRCLVFVVLLVVVSGCVGDVGEAAQERLDQAGELGGEDPEPQAPEEALDELGVHVNVTDTVPGHPGAQASLQGEIVHANGPGEDLRLGMDAPAGWETQIVPSVAPLEENGTVRFTATIDISEQARQGATYDVDVIVKTTDEDPITSVPVTVQIGDASVVLHQHDVYGAPGGLAPVTGTVTVSGQAPEEVHASLDGPDGWEATLTTHEGTNRSLSFTAWIAVPDEAEQDTQNPVKLELIGDEDRTLGHATATVTVAKALQEPTLHTWDKTHLEILIVPPAHGPIASLEEGPLPEGAQGAAPAGAYLDATLQALDDWALAIDTVSRDVPYLSWMDQVSWNVSIIGEDVLTPADVQQADIVKTYAASQIVLGAAYPMGGGIGPGCIAYSSMWTSYGSMSYEDMYKVAGHELGHCLGAGHTENDSDDVDIMTQGGYPHTDLRCPSNLNLHAIAPAYADAAGVTTVLDADQPFKMPLPAYERYCGDA